MKCKRYVEDGNEVVEIWFPVRKIIVWVLLIVFAVGVWSVIAALVYYFGELMRWLW